MAIDWSGVLQDYHDNAGYESSGSVAAARAYVAAARRLLAAPKKIQSGQEITEFDKAVLRDQISAAQAWLTANDTDAGGVIHPSFEEGVR